MPYLARWRRIARLMQLRARVLRSRKEEQKAFQQAETLVHFGHRVEDAKGGIIHYLVGLSFKHMGWGLVERMLPDTTLNAEQLRARADALAAFGANDEGLITAFKVEYLVAANAIRGLASGDLSASALGVDENQLKLRSKPTGYLLQPNATRRLFANFYTQLRQCAGAHKLQ